MDKENSKLLHGLLFAVAVIVMVYAGEQVKVNPTGNAAVLMKCSAATAALSLVSVALSFLPASKSCKYGKLRSFCESWINTAYKEKQDNIDIKTIKLIEQKARELGYYGGFQDIYNSCNYILTVLAATFLAVSVVLFSIGVCLL